jgi:hypothetical protein
VDHNPPKIAPKAVALSEYTLAVDLLSRIHKLCLTFSGAPLEPQPQHSIFALTDLVTRLAALTVLLRALCLLGFWQFLALKSLLVRIAPHRSAPQQTDPLLPIA